MSSTNSDNHKQNEKTAYRLGENICIHFQNIQTAHTTQQQKTQPNQKMGRRNKKIFVQRRHTDGHKAHEKMLNITNN